MEKDINIKMSPPPPSKTSSNISDLSDELEDLQLLPRPYILMKQPNKFTPTDSTVPPVVSAATASSNSSVFNSNSSSNLSSFGSIFSDDFTIGSKDAFGNHQSSSNPVLIHHKFGNIVHNNNNSNHFNTSNHNHFNHSGHSSHYGSRRASHPSNNYNSNSSRNNTNSKERYVFSK